MTTKTKSYSTIRVYIASIITTLIILLSACSNEQPAPQTPEIRVAEGLIWRNPDSCRQILASIDYYSLPFSEQMYWQLLHEHANQKGRLLTSPDSIMPMVIDYFAATNNYRYLGEAYYVQGLQYNFLLRHREAVLSLKYAETYIPYQDTLQPYIGMIYYKLGKVCESEQLYTIAEEYYLKSVPYFIKCNSHHYLAYCYNDISRTHPRLNVSDTITSFKYYQKALYEAQLTHNLPLYYDIMYQYELNRITPDSSRLHELGLYMVDSLGQNRQAAIVSEYYLNHGNIRGGEEYLSRFASDTLYSDWAKIQYRYLQSLLYQKTGRTLLAYNMLQQVYHELWTQLQEDADARVYAISRHYDLEREQNRSLQLQIEKQRLHITIAGVVALLLICILAAWLIIVHQRTEKRITQQKNEQERLKAQAERLLTEKKYIEAEKQRADAEKQRIEVENKHQEAQSRIMQLNAELHTRREALKQNLQLRIDLTKRLHQLPEKDLQHLSKAFTDSLASVKFSNHDTWQQFLHEYNDLYANMLDNIQRDYPRLTEKDLQYIALATLDLSINDICYLLGTTERTIWNRRQRIKGHVGNADMDVDDWIRMLGPQA